MEQQDDYENIFLVGVDGVTIAASDGTGRNLSEREYFKEAISGKTFFSQPVLAKASSHILIVAAAPVMIDGKVVGVVGITAPLSYLYSLLSSAWIGKTGEAYIIDSQGRFLTASRFNDYLQENGIILEHAELELQVDTYASNQIAARQSGAAEYSNYMSNKVIGVYQYIPGIDWGVIVEQTEAEAQLPYDNLRIISFILLILSGITLLMIVVSLVIYFFKLNGS
jgi:methyl-accepting chemotaxis protein